MPTEIKSPLSEMKPSEAADEILLEIFNTAFNEGNDLSADEQAWNAKLLDGFRKSFGYDYPGKSDISPMALYGPPGHGKSASFRAAGEKFAHLMGLNFHEDPPADFIPDPKKDFVMITMEMAGEVSNQTVGGIPSKSIMVDSEGNEHAIMDKLVQRQFLFLKEAAAGVLLLDDFNNASHNVQNMLLPIAQYRRFQTVKFGNCYVGFTGNLGAADGTQVFNPKLALKSRMRQAYVEDSPEDFIMRTDRKYESRPLAFTRAKDIVGAFIASQPDKFAGNPADLSVEQGDTYNCPRTWQALIEKLGARLGRFESSSAGSSALAAQKLAHEIVGSKVCQEFGTYFYQMMTSALPLARELLDTGTLKAESEEKLKANIGSSITGPEQDFSQQFAFALANVTAEKLLLSEKSRGEKKVKAMNDVGRAFFSGISRLESSHQFLSFTRLRARIENVIGDTLEKSSANDRGNEIWKALASGMGTQMKADNLGADEIAEYRDLLARTLGKRDALSSDKLNVN